MDLKKTKENAKEILQCFVDEIGLNGETYSKLNKTPVIYGQPLLGGLGEYISPESERLSSILKKMKYEDKTKEILNERGLILLSQEYKNKEPDSDLYVTLIHEMIHANRNLLLFDAFREGRNESAYSFNNGRIEQNVSNYSTEFADASQEILKGSIDTSYNTRKNYDKKDAKAIEEMEWAEGKIDSQMEKQQIVDESLAELISVLSYKLYSSKKKESYIDIWKAIEQAKEVYEGEDIGTMCEIILRHHDFELFYWMLDPISYSKGDIHYDFFSKYTENDSDLVEKLYDSTLDMDEYIGISMPSIDFQDVKEVATSKEAIEELPKSFEELRQAQNHGKGEK